MFYTMKKILILFVAMLFSYLTYASGKQPSDSVYCSIGLNAGFGFSNKGDLPETPFVMDFMAGYEICFPSNFLFGLYGG